MKKLKNKFKIGDKVVVIEDGLLVRQGTTAIVELVYSYYVQVVYSKPGKDYIPATLHFTELEFEAIYNSSLYKVLNEE